MNFKFFLLIITYLSINNICSGEAFDYLEKQAIDDKNHIYFHYNKKDAEVFNVEIKNFTENKIFIRDYEYFPCDHMLGIFNLSADKNRYYICFSYGPSWDFVYSFFQYEKVRSAINQNLPNIDPDFFVDGVSLVIPGNGFLYAYGHNNSISDIKRKYVFSNNNVKEVQQSFSYIGKKTKSLIDIIAYTDESLSDVVYTIPKGYDVTVVGTKYLKEARKEFYLVASQFGLIGWVPVEYTQKASQFEGFFYAGD